MKRVSGPCLIAQPIHRDGLDILQQAGLSLRSADGSSPAQFARDLAGCVAVVTRNQPLTAEILCHAPELRVIGVHGIGLDHVAVPEATRQGIVVVNTPLTNIRSVAEHAIGMIMALTKAFAAGDRAVRANDFAFKYRARLHELTELTLGIVGFGRIGQETARLARALGMRVIAVSRHASPAAFAATGVARCPSLEALLGEADVVSLHLPITPQSRGLIGRSELAAMKPGAFLVNTGRGGVVDEAALAEALTSGTLAGAGLDVFQSENMSPDTPLLACPNALLTPHIAGSTQAALTRTAREVAHQVLAALGGERPSSLVNPEAWPRRRGLEIGS